MMVLDIGLSRRLCFVTGQRPLRGHPDGIAIINRAGLLSVRDMPAFLIHSIDQRPIKAMRRTLY